LTTAVAFGVGNMPLVCKTAYVERQQPYLSNVIFKSLKVRNCEMAGLKDLDQSLEHVRKMAVDFMNTLIGHGVAGFR
jgi:hypothetical protein